MAFHRRTILRGMFQGSTAIMALPFLDCFLDGNGTALAATGRMIPTRFGTYFYGCGLTKTIWVPDSVGADYDVKSQIAPLAPYKKKLSLLSGLRVVSDSKPNYQHWTGVALAVPGRAAKV